MARPRFEYEMDVHDALAYFAFRVGIRMQVDPAVQGRVEFRMDPVVNPEMVLRTILSQVQGTYRITGGVYEVIPRPIRDLPSPPQG
jgi:hypothetical protein